MVHTQFLPLDAPEVAVAAIVPLILLVSFYFYARAKLAQPERSVADADTSHKSIVATWLVAVAMGIILILLALRAAAAHSVVSTVTNFFDSSLVLALLVLLAWMYYRLTHQLRDFAPFLLPMAAALLILGVTLSFTSERHFHDDNPWTLVHVVSVLLGFACFAVGCVAGMVYLISESQLRRKDRTRWTFPRLPPLDRLERFTRHCIIVGFPLLTLGAVSGIFRAVEDPHALGHDWWFSPKVVLTVLAWLVYASLLHVRLAPALRGSRCAWLSIIGFAILLAVLIAANWMPHG
jgi:ABC-type uncharacterized transport system permease subunit